jgi:hypothetical protein
MKRFLLHICKILPVYLLLILVASCKTSKSTDSSAGIKELSDTKYLEEVIKNAPSFDSFSSKMRLTINLDGKETSVNGSLKMKKNDLIQLSIAPILGIEVARIEISKDSVLVIDRINKRYVYVPISTLSFLANGDMNFYTLQALFFNELFLPGKQEVTPSDLSAFTVRQENNKATIRLKKTKKFDYNFTTDPNKQLTNTDISALAKYQLKWEYRDFKPLNKQSFPSQMNITLAGIGKEAKAQIDLSKMGTDKIRITKTSVSGKYKQISTNELLKLLLSL